LNPEGKAAVSHAAHIDEYSLWIFEQLLKYDFRLSAIYNLRIDDAAI